MAQLRQVKPTKKLVLCAAGATAAVAGSLLLPTFVSPGVVINDASDVDTSFNQVDDLQGSEATGTQSSIQDTVASTSEAKAFFVVHVDGAVAFPGVYELEEGSRVNDVIEKAGGLTSDADTSSLNLAAKVGDGQKIRVPIQGEAAAAEDSASGSATSEVSGSTVLANGLVNINSATAEELDALPGVGPSTAATIIQDREQSGPFTSIEDLMRISGIGEKKFAKLKDYICV